MKKSLKYLFALIACTLIAVGAFCIAIHTSKDPYQHTDLLAGELMLINDEYRLDKDYSPELVTLSNGERVAESMYPQLQKMFDDMREQKIFPVVRSGFRSYDEQRLLVQSKIREYIEQGLSAKKARAQAALWVASPGASEHQSGLAVDINCEKDKSTPEQVYSWLEKNAHKYGFIQRYPENKREFTGIAHEPWQYRFVGKDAAFVMYEKDLCLEQYTEKFSYSS